MSVATRSTRALHVGEGPETKFIFVPTSHQRLSSGFVTIPHVAPFMGPRPNVSKRIISVNSNRVTKFVLYYTHDKARYEQSGAVLRGTGGKKWWGEIIAFRKASDCFGLVNMRAGDEDLVWLAIEKLIGLRNQGVIKWY